MSSRSPVESTNATCETLSVKQIATRTGWPKSQWELTLLTRYLPKPARRRTISFVANERYRPDDIEDLIPWIRANGDRLLADAKADQQRREEEQRRREHEELRCKLDSMGIAEQALKRVQTTYDGSDGAATSRLHRELERSSILGKIAAELLRAQKRSTRAKSYGTRKHRGYAYSDKAASMSKVTSLLSQHGGLVWGWGEDPDQRFATHVLYVELPTGQVSFHALTRGEGPDYPGGWDGEHCSEERIIWFAAQQLSTGSSPDEKN